MLSLSNRLPSLHVLLLLMGLSTAYQYTPIPPETLGNIKVHIVPLPVNCDWMSLPHGCLNRAR